MSSLLDEKQILHKITVPELYPMYTLYENNYIYYHAVIVHAKGTCSVSQCLAAIHCEVLGRGWVGVAIRTFVGIRIT